MTERRITEPGDAAGVDSPKKAAPRKKAGRGKRLGCGCLSFLVALGVGVVVLEWVLRQSVGHFLGAPPETFRMYEQDDERSYRHIPGWTGELTVDGRTTAIRINSRGMRGPEVGAKEPGELRVLVFGDSFVFGRGVAGDETVPAQLQKILRAEVSSNLRVGNCGVAGHGTADMVRSVERHRDLDPDLIIACTYIGNDFNDDCRRYIAIVEGYRLEGPMARLAHTSTRFQLTLRYRTLTLAEKFFANYAPSLAFDRSQLQQTPDEVEAFRYFPPENRQFGCLYFDRRAEDALVQKVLDRCRENYASIERLASPVPVLHVIFPTWWHLDDDVWRKKLEQIGFEQTAYEIGLSQKRLLRLAKDTGIAMIDLTPKLRDFERRDDLWLPTDRHFSARGCAQVAAWLVPEVRRILGK